MLDKTNIEKNDIVLKKIQVKFFNLIKPVNEI